MKRLSPLHKIYGRLRMIQVCRDCPKWFHEYLSALNDDCYRRDVVSTCIRVIDRICT